jgi:hypothetical protein
VRVASVVDEQVPSPATAMQILLARRLGEIPDEQSSGRWTPRRTIAVSASVSLALWAAIAAAAYAAFR